MCLGVNPQELLYFMAPDVLHYDLCTMQMYVSSKGDFGILNIPYIRYLSSRSLPPFTAASGVLAPLCFDHWDGNCTTFSLLSQNFFVRFDVST